MTDCVVAGPDGFATFVREQRRPLLGTAYLLTGSQDAAEELLQDTLVALYPKWGRVAAADQPVAYVRRALTNRFVSSRRSPAARDLSVWDTPEPPAQGDVADTVTDRRVLFQLLSQLPPRQRAAIVLRYFHDRSDEQIAGDLGCRAATVRSLVSRGSATLRALYAREHAPTSAGGGAR